MKHIILIVPVFLCLLIGCSTSSSGLDKNANIATLVSSEDYLIDTAYFKLQNIVKLETVEASFLRRIDKIMVDENRLFVFDKSLKKIVIFDINGKYITQIHSVGQGPGEYEQFTDFALNTRKKEIIISCDRPYKTIWFDYSGKFIREKRMDTFFYKIGSDNEYIYGESLTMENEYSIAIMDGEANLIESVLPKIENAQSISFFTAGNSLSQDKKIYYTRRFDNHIYRLENGNIIPEYYLDFKEYNFPESILKNIASDEHFKERELDRKYVYSITDVVEADKYIVFNTNLGVFFLEKKSGNVMSYRRIFNKIADTSHGSFTSLGNSNNIIYVSQAYWITEKGQKVSDRLKDVQEDDNPVLFIYEFK